MMITSKHFFGILFAACLLVCFNGMAEVPNNPVADVMVRSSGITWVPKVNYTLLTEAHRLTLTWVIFWEIVPWRDLSLTNSRWFPCWSK